MMKSFHKPLNVRDLPRLFGCNYNIIEELYVGAFSYSTQRYACIHRSDSDTVLRGLRAVAFFPDTKKGRTLRNLFAEDSYIKDSDGEKRINAVELLKYAYRYTLEKPCIDENGCEKTAETLFLELLQVAFNVGESPKSEDVDFLKELKQMDIEEFKSDDKWVDVKSIVVVSKPRELAINRYNEIRNNGRFRGYAYTQDNLAIKGIKNVLEYNGESKTLEEIVFPENKKKWRNSVCLIGKGGTGKTHQFINLINLILYSNEPKYNDVIPFYLELNNVGSITAENVVLSHIAVSLGITIDSYKYYLSTQGENTIFFLDGLNEVTNGKLRNTIIDAICDIRANYGSRIILSSRDDYSSYFNTLGRGENQIFEKAQVAELRREQIVDYIKESKVKINYDYLPYSTKELLKTAQGLSMYVALSLNDPTIEVHDMGHLLLRYIDLLLKIDRNDYNSLYEHESALKLVAYKMALKGTFVVGVDELKRLVSKQAFDDITQGDRASAILAFDNDDNKNKYEITHQNFRDLLSGMVIVDRLKSLVKKTSKDEIASIIKGFLSNNYVNTNDEILSLAADFLTSEDIQKAIDLIRNNNIKDIGFTLSLLIKLFAMVNNGCISKLDLSEIDLRNISLSGYKLFSVDHEKNETYTICLDDAIISENTFLQNGLQAASSAICTYKLDNKVYVSCFTSTNIMTYDVNNNSYSCIRDLENNGWINCCCPVEEDNKVYILLGCESGDIKCFDPSTKTVSMYSKFPWKHKCGVESILAIKSSDGTSIAASDKHGNVFVVNKRRIFIRVTSDVELREMKALFAKKSKEIFEDNLIDKNLRMISRLTASKKYLYCCLGNKIYRAPFPINSKTKFEPNPFMVYSDNTVIRDIYYTKFGIMLNKLKEISYLRVKDTEKNADENPIEAEAFTINNIEKLEYFTKFSGFYDPEYVIVGVSAKDNDYTNISNLCYVKYEKNLNKCVGGEISRTMHSMTTHTGTYFKSNGTDIYRFASVSDDRSMQILNIDDPSIDNTIHKGNFDGVRKIAFIDESRMLVAQYDGCISYWECVATTRKWKCKKVYNIHNNWVWGIINIYPGYSYNSAFVSWSHDGTVKKTTIRNDVTETLIISNNHEKFIDVASYNNGNSIIAISDTHLYWLEKGKLKDNGISIPTNPDWLKYVLRSVANIDDKAFIAVEVTLGTNNNKKTNQCYIVSRSNKTFNTEIICEKSLTRIKGIKICQFQQNIFLFVYGACKSKAYFGIYHLVNNKWVYKGSLVPDDCNIGIMNVYDGFAQLYESLHTSHQIDPGPINDIDVITPYDHKENEFDFYVATVHSKKYFSLYRVLINSGKSTKIGTGMRLDTDSQPLCVSSCDGLVAYGKQNGKIETVALFGTRAFDTIKTHANLLSNVSVDLKTAIFSSESEKESFRISFDGYFDFKDEDLGNNYKVVNKNGTKMLAVSPINSSCRAEAFISVKSSPNGHSKGAQESFSCNLYKNVGQKEGILDFNTFCKSIDVDTTRIVTNNLSTFNSEINIITQTMLDDYDVYNLSKQKCANGLVTSEKDVALYNYAADCQIIFYLDKKKPVVGMTHCSYRGPLDGIIEAQLNTFKDYYLSDIKDIIVVLSPCISSRHYTVSEEIYKEYEKKELVHCFYRDLRGKYHLDLTNANYTILINNGVLKTNIYSMSELCTYENSDYFHSYRRSKEIVYGKEIHNNGLNGYFIMLK